MRNASAVEVVTGVVVTALLAFGLGFITHEKSVRYEIADLKNYRNTYLWKQGGTLLVPNATSYLLFSADGGKNWYALENPSEFTGEVKIRGTADKIYPGLLKNLHAMEALSEYVKKNGPLTFSEGRKEIEKKILEDAGYTVRTKK